MTVFRGPESGDPVAGGGGGILDSDGTQGATFANETIERVFYTLTIPANTVQIGDLINIQFFVEMLSPGAGGGVRTRIRRDDGIGPIIVDSGGFTLPSLPGVAGFTFFHASVIDTGSGLSAARFYEDSLGVDSALNFTADVVLAFTGEWNTAAAGNEYRGLGAHVSRN